MLLFVMAREAAMLGLPGLSPAIPQRAEFLRLCSSAARHQSAVCVLSLLGDDVDDAIHRIGAPYCSSRPADHFNSFNVLQGHILRVPIHAPKSGVYTARPSISTNNLLANCKFKPPAEIAQLFELTCATFTPGTFLNLSG